MKKWASAILLQLLSFVIAKSGDCQTGSYLKSPGFKNFVPASPTSTALGKYGETPVSLYTGIPNITIPLYQLKGRSLQVPISLNYHAGGNRVEELASWVGLGWSLNAGGVITRTVRGGIVDFSSMGYNKNQIVPFAKKYLTNANPLNSFVMGGGNGLSEDWTLMEQIKQGFTDAEPDLYHFNFAGYSGTFFQDETGQIVVSPLQGIRIEYFTISGEPQDVGRWVITTTDGIKYVFGYTLDNQSKGIEKNDNGGANSSPITSWYLVQIISPDNDIINFTYTNISYNYKNKSGEVINLLLDQSSSVNSFPAMPLTEERITTNFITFPKLTSITSSLAKITFTSTGARNDLPGDNYLNEISIFDNENLSTPRKKIVFSYTNVQRLILDKIEESAPSESSVVNKYQFQYNALQLPNPNPEVNDLNSQDLWGYYNGVSNTVLPGSYAINTSYAGIITLNGADRHSDEAKMKAQILEKIIYPTGGYTVFDYEANSIYTSSTDYVPLQPVGKGASLQYQDNQTVTKEFTITDPNPNTNNVLVTVIARAMVQGCPVSQSSGHSSCYEASIEGINGTVFPKIYVDSVSTINLTAGSYKITGKGIYNPGQPANNVYYLNLNWNEYPTQQGGGTMINKIVGGLRIKKITDFDGIQTYIKKYSYNKFGETASSGVLVNKPSFYPNFYTVLSSDCASIVYKLYAQIKSFPALPLMPTQGGCLGYKNVTESLGENAENGKTEFTFYTADEQPDGIKDYRPYPPSCSYDLRRGLLRAKTIYKNSLSSFIPVSSTLNEYDFGINTKTAYGVCVDRDAGVIDPVSYDENSTAPCFSLYVSAKDFFVSGYKTIAEFFYLKTETARLYDQNNPTQYSETIKNFEFDQTSGNYQLKRVSVKNSKKETIQTDYKYPHDFSGTAIYDAMIVKNMIRPVIETINTNITLNNTLLAKDHTNYALFNNVPQISSVENALLTNTLETEYTIDQYDDKGNILQVTPKDGIKKSFIWAHNKTYPITEAVNTIRSDVAYESFEAETDGANNWSYTLTPSVASDALTGKKILNLTSGNTISRGGLVINKKYIVSYWSKNGKYTVNNATTVGNPITGNKLDNWTYYQHTIKPTSASINISGVGAIDELRLYPEGALMNTMTYDPISGMTSKCDVNNRIFYFEYDGYGRLKIVRDQNRFILSRYCYNNAGQQINCDNIITWGNKSMTKAFVNNTCASGIPATINYTVDANKFFSTISPQDANDQATVYLNAEGQKEADKGFCYNSANTNVDYTSNIGAGIQGFKVKYTSKVLPYTVYETTINTSSATGTLFTIPYGFYDVSIIKTGNTALYDFWLEPCYYGQKASTYAQFFNISVTPTCNKIKFEIH